MGVEQKLDTVYVLELKYMEELQKVLTSTPIEDIKTIMKWTTLNGNASLLTTELEMANWDFYSKTLRGTQSMQPREERAMDNVTGRVGEAIGKLYVKAKFPPEAKEKAEKMIANVITAFKGRIDNLEWMSPDTKEKAKLKLDKFTVKIAYPDEWEEYEDLMIKEGNGYFENMQALSDWNLKVSVKKLYCYFER